MDFAFLYDRARHLFAVGYNADERRRDPSCYDLLASEARLSCFVAIAQGQVPQESWFALGRLLTSAGGRPILLSWSGSMFEYLMPLLVMPTYEHTLLDETCRAAVERQIAYGRQLGVPWGMSESGYNAVDASLNYQYRAFGVPGLGLKRGLAEDVVVAPYASVLALMVAPEAACLNLQRLAAEGLAGRFGLFEAVDYTPARLPRGQTSAVVRSFMAHHQGMSVLALGHLLLDRPMQRRFASDPLFQATLLLLQERIPNSVALLPHVARLAGIRANVTVSDAPVRVIGNPATPIPEVQLLSNGRYHVMVTNAGGGSSRWKDLAVTRWREDATCDNWGTFCYLRDVASGEVWSTAHQPTATRADHYEAIFSEGRAEFRRRDHGLDVHTEIAVSPEDDIELRRARIVNRTRSRRVIELTSYAEIVLAPPAEDAIHPAFSNLFVQTEIAGEEQAILCTRRPRSPGEPTPWMFHLMAVHGATATDVFVRDRSHALRRPRQHACGTAGDARGDGRFRAARARCSTRSPPSGSGSRSNPSRPRRSTWSTASPRSREAAIGLARKYQRSAARGSRRRAGVDAEPRSCCTRSTPPKPTPASTRVSPIRSSSRTRRCVPMPGVIARNRRGQSGLWGYAISGDLPIVLLRIADRCQHRSGAPARAGACLLAPQGPDGGSRDLERGPRGIPATASGPDHGADRGARRSPDDGSARRHLRSARRPDFRGGPRSPRDRSRARSSPTARARWPSRSAGARCRRSAMPKLLPEREHRVEAATDARPARELILGNGLGGFTPDGTEYVITTDRDRLTPAPWVNVLANPHFGAIVSESGSGYTWSDNAHEFRLTPWNNDPVSDASGEAVYLRDEESGHFWSATPLPARGRTPYVTRHGFGYTVFEHDEDGICTELWVHVAGDAAVKFSTLKVRNASGRSRRISVTGYVEWVLGDLRPKSVMHVVTEKDAKTGALFARNPYSTEFGDRVAFFDVDDTTRTLTCDRAEFIGRNGTLAAPAAMARTRLTGKSGPALDPCAALQVPLELDAGRARRDLQARHRAGRRRCQGSGAAVPRRGRSAGRARRRVPAMAANADRHPRGNPRRGAERARQRLARLPDAGMPAVGAKRLLPVRGRVRLPRSAAGRPGARPCRAAARARAAAACAARQFVEGDVQHWWHPPSGRGVRTQCSDDYLWLPLATCPLRH